MSARADKPTLVYVGDPLCSWCWGFQPSLRKALHAFKGEVDFELVVGGLRTGASALPLNDELREYLRRAWREVEHRSGQPFDFTFLDRANFVYDTEPACRAVVAARTLAPDKALGFNEAIQESFYHRGLDPTDRQTFLTVAREQALSEEKFGETFDAVSTDTATQSDFERARRLGAHGFPTVLLHKNDTWSTVTRGFVPPEVLVDLLRDHVD